MLRGASSTAIVRVRLFIAPLAAPYAANPPMPTTDWPDEMLMIEPPPAAARCGMPYLHAQNTLPVSALSRIRFHSSVVTSTSGLMFEPISTVGAALFTRVVSEPNRSTTPAITPATLSSLVTSRAKNSASPPSARMRSTTFCPRSTVRPVTATWAPSAACICAIDRPIPRVEPETSATFPSSLISCLPLSAATNPSTARPGRA